MVKEDKRKIPLCFLYCTFLYLFASCMFIWIRFRQFLRGLSPDKGPKNGALLSLFFVFQVITALC